MPVRWHRIYVEDQVSFPPPNPQPGEWLAETTEPGQTAVEHALARPVAPATHRSTSYLLPFADLGKTPSLECLRDYQARFFGMRCRVLPPIDPSSWRLTRRYNPSIEEEQVLTTSILRHMRRFVPADAYSLIGLTLADLYSWQSIDSVFGQAMRQSRLAICSFARFHPDRLAASSERALLMRRSLNLLAHETAHTFGLRHCTYYRCFMNGSRPDDRHLRPLHACQVCLRKLHWLIGFDPIDRYRSLARFYERYGLEAEARWVRRRLAILAS